MLTFRHTFPSAHDSRIPPQAHLAAGAEDKEAWAGLEQRALALSAHTAPAWCCAHPGLPSHSACPHTAPAWCCAHPGLPTQHSICMRSTASACAALNLHLNCKALTEANQQRPAEQCHRPVRWHINCPAHQMVLSRQTTRAHTAHTIRPQRPSSKDPKTIRCASTGMAPEALTEACQAAPCPLDSQTDTYST